MKRECKAWGKAGFGQATVNPTEDGPVTVDPGAALERDASGFAYVVNNKRPQYSDAVLMKGLRRFGREVGGRAFTRQEFDAWVGKPCAAGTVANRMGGWWVALRKAGVGGVRGEAYTAEALMVNLRAIWRRKGRVPGGPRGMGQRRMAGSRGMRGTWRWGEWSVARIRATRGQGTTGPAESGTGAPPTLSK